MPTLIFRGVELLAGNYKILEEGLLFRHKLIADLSVVAARGLGLEDMFFGEDGSLKTFREEFSVSGERLLTEGSLDPNGLSQHKIGFTATRLLFEIYTKQGKEEDDPADARIRLTIETLDPFNEFQKYIKVAGTAAAVLKLKVSADQDKQMSLDEQKQDEDGVGEDEEAGPALASAREVGERTRKK